MCVHTNKIIKNEGTSNKRMKDTRTSIAWTYKENALSEEFVIFLCSSVRASWIYVNNCPTRRNYTQFIYICKLLYTFRVESPPIIRSSYHCIYSVWHLCDRYCKPSLTWLAWNKPTTLRTGAVTTGCSNVVGLKQANHVNDGLQYRSH
jgi:hypothetical protein